MMSISVVMATYNGAKYLKAQMDSIVPYLEEKDELIVSDDGSTDGSRDIIKGYIKHYPNVRLIAGPCKGVIKNFENGILHAKNDIIMFSDQDDVWLPEKLPLIRKLFDENPNVSLIHHDKIVCNNKQIESGNGGYASLRGGMWHHGVLHNLLMNCYYGCCIAMRKSFIKQIVPFVESTVAYDQLVGLIAENQKCSMFISTPLIKRRIHGNNMSHKLPLLKRFVFRFHVWQSYRDTLKKINGNTIECDL